MKRFAVGFVVVILFLTPLAVLAQLARHDDPRDTPGLLDVRRVKISGKLERPIFKTITFKEWTANRIWDRGYFIVHLDARGGSHFEHYILVRSVGGRLEGTLYRDRRHKPDFVVGEVDVWRVNQRSVTTRVRLHRLNMPAERTYYRWFVKSLMIGNNCPTVCMDRVPDSGAVEQLVIEPTPEPTVTVEPTPEPTVTTEPTPEPTVTTEPTPEPTDAP